MMTPVRCMSCGKPVAGLVEKFQQRTKAGENSNKVLNELGVTRYCCRGTKKKFQKKKKKEKGVKKIKICFKMIWVKRVLAAEKKKSQKKKKKKLWKIFFFGTAAIAR